MKLLLVRMSSAKRIKIPNACIGLDLTFMTFYEMLRREKAKFILGGQALGAHHAKN